MKYTITVDNAEIRTYEAEAGTPEEAIAAVKAGTAKMTSANKAETLRADEPRCLGVAGGFNGAGMLGMFRKPDATNVSQALAKD